MFLPADIYRTCGHYVANLKMMKSNVVLGNGSGFMVDGKLVTCAHNLQGPTDADLVAIFDKSPFEEGTNGALFSDPRSKVRAYSEEHCFDYAVLEFLKDIKSGVDGLTFSDRKPLAGEPVCSLGWPSARTPSQTGSPFPLRGRRCR